MATRLLALPDTFPVRTAMIGAVRVAVIGHLHEHDARAAETITAACTSNGVLRDDGAIAEALRSLRGNFAFVMTDCENRVLAAVDKIKSYPVFVMREGTSCTIGCDARAFHSTGAPSHDAVREFAMTGYVTMGETLVPELRQLRGGEALIAESGGATRIVDYYQFAGTPRHDASFEDAVAECAAVTRGIFERLAQRLAGRTALIPLSGGYDSRLVLTMLRHVGYDRIQTFSYGVPGNCEAAAARVIAERVGVPWTFVPYTRTFGRALYHTSEREQYFAFAHERSAIPMMTDFYAFCDDARRAQLPKNAVVINGQTGDCISGGHIPAACMAPTVTRRAFLDAILAKHYSLWSNLRTPANDVRMEQRIIAALGGALPDAMEPSIAVQRYQEWEWRARQCEHVVRGQRVYDFFGLAWELPLWDDAYLDFWVSVPAPLQYRQLLYGAMLRAYDPYGVFQAPLRRFTPPWPAAAASVCFAAFGAQADTMRRKYLQYWQKYAYFYAIYPYREYRRFATDHRNPSSCLAQTVLAEYYGVQPETLLI
ncbi:MAG: asparagine synthase C-terminal domain-containing protein [bacterium]|nr:asparagine synthase C-terminal domain-containing protein [bacterium]